MFQNPILERLSHVHPATPLVIYVPVIALCFAVASMTYGLSAGRIIGTAVLGYFAWTMLEYWLHRLVFHLPVRGKWTQQIYFFVHGVHHDWPWDTTRLVLPPTLSITLSVGFYLLFTALFTPGVAHAAFGGLLFGYLIYDMLHWFTHVGAPKNRVLKHLRKQHMIHHFRQPNTRFGVSCPWWDWVFRTQGTQETQKISADTIRQSSQKNQKHSEEQQGEVAA